MVGKTFGWASNVDVTFSIEVTRYYAGWADKVTGQVVEVGGVSLLRPHPFFSC